MSTTPIFLEDFASLEKELGSSFCILCGSAISTYTATPGQQFLPMVYQVSEKFFLKLAERLQARSYYQKAIAEYARELATGNYKERRKRTKFEEFIGQLELLLGKSSVEELLEALFLCDDSQFTFNHSAIVALLHNRRATACFTTNFDNAIELASGLVPFVHPDHPDQQTINSSACLIKLHGDVKKRVYVATLPRMLTAERIREHAYLTQLLEGKTVLIIGYSGNGDIDITPHLRQLVGTMQRGTKLIWAVYPKRTPVSHDPLEYSLGFATHWCLTDLSTPDTTQDGPNTNILLKLAATTGYSLSTASSKPPWEQRLDTWFERVDIDKLQDIIRQIFYNWNGMIVSHLSHVLKWETHPDPHSPSVLLDGALTHIGVSAYYSAKRLLWQAEHQHHDDSVALTAHFFQGFADWRLGFFERAMRRFEQALEVSDSIGLPSSAGLGETPKDKAEIVRLFLEVGRDRLAALPSMRTRQDLYKDLLADKAVLLQRWLPNALDAQQQALGYLVLYNLEYLTGLSTSPEPLLTRLSQLVARGKDLSNDFIVNHAARMMSHLDPQQSKAILDTVEAKIPTLRFGNRIVRLDALFHLRGPYFVNVWPWRLMRAAKAIYDEIRLRGKLLRWRLAFGKEPVYIENT